MQPYILDLQSDPHKLRQQITSKFSGYDLNNQYDFDQILFILDEKSISGKCDRDVARQLFEQSKGTDRKATLNQIIFKYVENLQTSKLCLNRQEKGEEAITNKLRKIQGSKKTYVYLKLIQATVYARHSSTPSFSYKIWPSDIPPVTVVNSLNPILNHQYTLQLEEDNFSIIFYDSGVKIAQWTWPDSPQSNREGEYHRTIMTQNVSFELKINYQPKNSHPDKNNLQQALLITQKKRSTQFEAFLNLSSFEPFMNSTMPVPPKVKSNKEGKMWALTQSIFSRIPCLKGHVRNLYYALILLIVIECLASMCWPMQFLDLTIAFGTIGMLYDRNQIDMGMEMLVVILSYIVLIIKSVWGAVAGNTGFPHFVLILIAAIIVKFICIFFAWIISIRKEEVPEQRQLFFYQGVDPKSIAPPQPQAKIASI